MKKKLQILILSFIILEAYSCRAIESEEIEVANNSQTNIALVSINPTGVEWEIYPISVNSDQQGVSAWDGEGNYLITSELQTENTSVKSYEIEFFDDIQAKNAYLNNGIKYIVQAFDYNTGLVADWKINTIGSTTEPLKLDGGKKYDIVIYSFNSLEVPPRVYNINDKFSYNFTDNTKEFLYHKQTYTPIGGKDNVLNITLKHKFSYAKFILNTRDLSLNNKGSSISGNPKLSNLHYKSGMISVIDGNLSGNSFSDLYFPMKYNESKDIHESDYIHISLKAGAMRGMLSVEIIAPASNGDEKKLKNIPINMTSGMKNVYTIKVIAPKIITDKAVLNIPINSITHDASKNQKNVCVAMGGNSQFDNIGFTTVTSTNFDARLNDIKISPNSSKYIRTIELSKISNDIWGLRVHGRGCIVVGRSEKGSTVTEDVRIYITSKENGKEITSKTLSIDFILQ